MNSTQLKTLSTASNAFGVVWLVVTGALVWNGFLGGKDSRDGLGALFVFAPLAAAVFGSEQLSKRSKTQAAAEALLRETAVKDERPNAPAFISDSSGEKPDVLEGAYKTLLGPRLRAAALQFGVFFLLVGCVIIYAVFTNETVSQVLTPNSSRLAESNSFFGDIFSGVHSSAILFQMALTAVVGLLAFVVLGIALYSVVKPLQAGTSPDDTCKRYFGLMLSHKWLPKNHAEAFVCLLDAAKNDFGGYKGFRDYWMHVYNDLQRNGVDRDIFLSSINPPGDTQACVTISRGDSTDSENRVTRSVTLSISTNKGAKTVRFDCPVDLMRVGSRWYLVSGRWAVRTG